MSKKTKYLIVPTDDRNKSIKDWRPNKIGITFFIIILVLFTITLHAQADVINYLQDDNNRLRVAYMERFDMVKHNNIAMINNGSDLAYCWTEFMGDDGLGFGARVWNFHVSVMSDCDILKQECLHFQNVSETFDCSWNDNTCTCRIRETEHCINKKEESSLNINTYNIE